MNFNSFSQTVTDTTIIKIPTPITRLIIKDLIRLDGLDEEVLILNKKIKLLENKVILKDSIIFSIEKKYLNTNSIIDLKNKQLVISQELSNKLEKDLKKEQKKNKFFLSSNVFWIVIILILI